MALDVDEEDFSEQVPDLSSDERRLFTQSFDLSIQTVLEQWNDRTLVLPSIQREYLWSDARASRLIESLLLNIPIPLLYFAETTDARWEIFDGHQRVRSVVRFAEGEFALRSLDVLGQLNGVSFDTMPPQDQRVFMRRMLRAVVITADSHPAMKYEIFERLNTGSVALNAQELRNSLFRGPFNAFLHELVHYEPFRECVGTASARRRMVDEELVLRFFALRDRLQQYRPPLKAFLNTYMRAHTNDEEEQLDAMRTLFAYTCDRLAATLGSSAFRMLYQDGRPADRAANRAVFDAQMLAFSWMSDEAELNDSDRALDAFIRLSNDAAFIDASQIATGDRARTLFRVQRTIQELQGVGFRIEPPFALG